MRSDVYDVYSVSAPPDALRALETKTKPSTKYTKRHEKNGRKRKSGGKPTFPTCELVNLESRIADNGLRHRPTRYRRCTDFRPNGGRIINAGLVVGLWLLQPK